jgi:hypothetical protein
MNKKLLYPLLFFVLIFTKHTSAQNLVNVNQLTGAANIQIPLYTIQSGQAVLPISISYTATGVRPKDVEGTAGMGWQLNVGGQITRVVRGIPDDVVKDNLGNTMLGWMSASNSGANAIPGFSISNSGANNCTNETYDQTYMGANFFYYNDTEPDVFYVNAPGLSCQLVYDRVAGKFRSLEYQDILISYSQNISTVAQPNQINAFTITNNKGIVYSFGVSDTGPSTEIVTQRTTGGTQAYLSNKFKQYQNGITYFDNWGLTAITDANGNNIYLNYSAVPARSSTDSVAFYVGGSSTVALQYYIKQTVTPTCLSSISTNTSFYASPQYMTFNWVTFFNHPQTGQTAISSVTGFGHNFTFSYSPVAYTPTGYTRNFLRQVSDAGCSSPINYQFSYIGETYTNGYYTSLPDSSSHKLDYWGYYSNNPTANSLIPSVYVNPSSSAYPRFMIAASGSPGSTYSYTLANSNRSADPTVITTGTLSKILYPTGGSTTLVYEPNDYYDSFANANVQGSGIRIKQIIDSVGKTSTNNIVSNYSYLNGSGYSSGKPITLPVFAFTTPYSGGATGLSLYQLSTVLSAYDLSSEDHTIMYTNTRVSRTGAGSTLYSYYVPSAYFDQSGSPGCSGCGVEWYPAVDNNARSNCTSSYGPIKNDLGSYPFIPSPNYDFERGLPLAVATYNDANALTSQSSYTYQRSYAPSAITAFRMELNSNAGLTTTGYNKYSIFYNTSELTSTVINNVTATDLSASQADTTTYFYNSSYHKLPSQVQKINSDRNIVNTYSTYVKDYPVTAANSNANINALYYLQQLNVNAPVETYSTKKYGANTFVTGGSLVLYNQYAASSGYNYLPQRQYKFISPYGVTSFNPFSINPSAPSVSYDGRYYFIAANFDTYDFAGNLITTDDNNHHISTAITDYLSKKVTAVFNNAAYREVAVSDFDSNFSGPLPSFIITGSGGGTAAIGHTGKGYNLATAQTIGKTVTKNAVSQNYIFSIWVNSTATGSLAVSLNNGTNTYNFPLAFANTSGAWKYYELKLPMANMTSAFTVQVTTSAAIAIDDILFYPDLAQASTIAYDPTTNLKVAETNTNGVSGYFNYDQWGRLLYAFDQDKNIVQRNSYVSPAMETDYSIETPAVSYTGPVYANTPVTLSITGVNPCVAAGVTVNWLFGDGTSQTTALANSPTHTYTATGNVNVSATVNSPLFGTKNASATIAVATKPPGNVALSYSNTTNGADISSISFTNSSGTTIFTGPQLNGASIPQGTYTVAVYVKGGTLYNSGTGTGYSCIYLNGTCSAACASYTSSNSYTFSNLNLSSCTSLNATISTLTCSQIGGGSQ